MSYSTRSRGFTLIDLMLAITVLAVLLGLALPTFHDAMEAARAASARSDLLGSLTSSISRAALFGEHVVLCSSRDASRCAGDADWSQGWVGFVDLDRNRQRSDNEPVVTAAPKLPGKVRLRTTVGRTRLIFQPNGGNAGSNATFTLCDGRGPDRARALALSNTGNLHEVEPKSASVAATCVSG